MPHGKSTLFEKWKRYMEDKKQQPHKFTCEKHAEKIEHEGWDCPVCLDIDEIEKQVESLTEELEESQQEVAELTGENVDLEEKKYELEQIIDDLNDEIKKLKTELRETKQGE
jgi:chromosome segregation ATPase